MYIGLDVHCHVIDKMTSAVINKNSKNISCYFNRGIDQCRKN